MSDLNLIDDELNPWRQTAWAGIVFSLVPYLGILFIPVAIGAAAVGHFTEKTNLGRRRHLAGLAASVVILLIQIGLWALLYIVPNLAVTPSLGGNG